MKKGIYSLSILFLLACNNNSKGDAQVTISKDTTADVTMRSAAPGLDGCYSSIMNKDTAKLHISINQNDVYGTLEYNIYEKDRNTGTISGRYQDSLIIANYTFQSEGISSVRQVVFKVANRELIEGQGEFEMHGDIAKFKDISQLKYPGAFRFIKVECP